MASAVEPAPRTKVERAPRTRVLFREVNERIAELPPLLDSVPMSLFICECSDGGCAESLEVTLAEYEAVRAHGDRFVVLAGHQLPAIDHVVHGNERYLVVEMTGDAAEFAMARDPRRS